MIHDNLRDNVGQAIADKLAEWSENNSVTLDPFNAYTIDEIADAVMPVVQAEIQKWREAEHELGAAYLRLRQLIPGALTTPYAPAAEQVWAHTEECLRTALQSAGAGEPVVWFPLLGTSLAIARECLNEHQAQRNHGQTLDRLAERGGLSPSEALAVIHREQWRHKTLREALTELVTITASAHPAPAGSPLGRDADWTLAMAKALGTDSGYSVPITPNVEAFRALFASVRAQTAPAGDATQGDATQGDATQGDATQGDAGALAEAVNALKRIADEESSPDADTWAQHSQRADKGDRLNECLKQLDHWRRIADDALEAIDKLASRAGQEDKGGVE